MTFEEYAADKGFDPNNLSDSAHKFLTTLWEEEVTRPEPRPATAVTATVAAGATAPVAVTAPKGVDVAAALRPLREDHKRQEDILALAVEHTKLNPGRAADFEAIAQDAIEKGTSFNDVRYAMLAADRGSGPRSTFVKNEPELGANVLEAAFCMQAGMGTAELEKHYDARTLDTAKKNFRHGIGLIELTGFCAKKSGYRGHVSKSNIEPMLRAAYADREHFDLRAGVSGPSTYSIPNIIANVANKYLDRGFLAIDNAWESITSIKSVPDFKQTSTNAVSSALQYKDLPPGGEIKHGTFGETNYTNQASTYAIQVGIDRRDLINDDSGALTSMSTHMGRGAALKINDKFWTVFLNNTGSFFTSGHANVSTGAGSALATADGAAINAAEVKFMNQTDPQGFPLAVMPRIMLVPPTLRNTAARWMGSQLFVGSTGLGDNNIFGGRYTIVSSPYMENSTYTGNSTAAWYLLCDPADLATVEGVFLNGQRTPTVETSDMDWNTLGISMRGYIDFGFALHEYRAGVRSAGS